MQLGPALGLFFSLQAGLVNLYGSSVKGEAYQSFNVFAKLAEDVRTGIATENSDNVLNDECCNVPLALNKFDFFVKVFQDACS